MALFKILRGNEDNLPAIKLTDGYAYFTSDTHNFYIDHLDANGKLVRSLNGVGKTTTDGKIQIGEHLIIETDGNVEIDGEVNVKKIIETAPNLTINLNDTVPSTALPSICDFEFKPTTPLCVYDLANQKVLINGPFNGDEVPFLTTQGDLIVTNENSEIKIKKRIDSLININRNGWNVSDKLTQDGVYKAWSKKFYLTKDHYVSRQDFDYGNAQNSRYVFEFDESEFAETGIPAKLDDIPVATPCFYTGNNAQAWLNDRIWGGQPFPLKFSYNKETGKYIMTIRGFGKDLLFYQMTLYSKAYIYYQLETPYIDNDFMAMGLEKGDTITFENDYSYIQKYLDASNFFHSGPSGGALTNSDTTPTFSATTPQSIADALVGFSNASKILNGGQATSQEAAQDYSWIGDGDGTTDYTSTIQNKIKELSSLSDGGTIYLGNGVYKINNFIEIPDNIKIIGTGNTIIQQTNKYSHVIVISGSNITLKDIKLKLYVMSADEKDNLQYNNDLTACVYINSNNSKSSENYTDKYLDNIYCKNLLMDGVHLLGSYGFRYINGKPTVSNDYEHYRGCGLIQHYLFFNYATLKNVHISGMYHGLHGVGGSNDITIFCDNTKVMVYGGGGYANLNIFGHSYYDTDENGTTISMSDEIGHFTELEQSTVAEYVYDVQWCKNIFVFEGSTMNNRYIVAQTAGVTYYGNTLPPQGRKLEKYIVDYGRGNRPIENYQNKPYHIGSKYIELTGLTSFKYNDAITQNALAGAGVWGTITSNDLFNKGFLTLNEICRYPQETQDGNHSPTNFYSIISEKTPTLENPIEIIIDISERPIHALPGGFIQFDTDHIASDFTVSFDTNNSNTYGSEIFVKDNIDTTWHYIPIQSLFQKIYRIKLTITKALYIPKLKYQTSDYTDFEIEYNPNKKIGICNIGMVEADFVGRTFLGECGGNMYGDYDLHNHTFKNLALPTNDNDAVSKSYADNLISWHYFDSNGTLI